MLMVGTVVVATPYIYKNAQTLNILLNRSPTNERSYIYIYIYIYIACGQCLDPCCVPGFSSLLSFQVVYKVFSRWSLDHANSNLPTKMRSPSPAPASFSAFSNCWSISDRIWERLHVLISSPRGPRASVRFMKRHWFC